MKASVAANFRKFNEPFEGCVQHMYLDIKGLVTVGVGNLIEPLAEALGLPWKWRRDSRTATREEVINEWMRVKANTMLAKMGATAAASCAELFLDDAAIGELIGKRLAHNELVISTLPAFWAWASWPADAQLAVHSMAWAVGPGGVSRFPRFLMAVARKDFAACAEECEIDASKNPGVRPRNAANKKCFENAIRVMKQELDPEVLHYPGEPKAAI